MESVKPDDQLQADCSSRQIRATSRLERRFPENQQLEVTVIKKSSGSIPGIAYLGGKHELKDNQTSHGWHLSVRWLWRHQALGSEHSNSHDPASPTPRPKAGIVSPCLERYTKLLGHQSFYKHFKFNDYNTIWDKQAHKKSNYIAASLCTQAGSSSRQFSSQLIGKKWSEMIFLMYQKKRVVKSELYI